MGTKSIQVPEEFHAYVKANKREDETMAEAPIRLTGRPHPDAVVGLLSEGTADAMRGAIDRRGEGGASGRSSATYNTTG